MGGYFSKKVATKIAWLEIGCLISDSVCSDIRDKQWLSHQPPPSQFGEVHGESSRESYLTQTAGWNLSVCDEFIYVKGPADCPVLQFY